MESKRGLPAWNNQGVLPPILPGEKGSSDLRAPYHTELSVLVSRFSTSPKRKEILEGFLAFRADLHNIGVTSGFQWLSGSFVENIEQLENRDPNDIDVVTFFDLPSDCATVKQLIQRNEALFRPKEAKQKYCVDGYFTPLNQSLSTKVINNITYWYSMWAHRRDFLWKGFIYVSLDPSQDLKLKEDADE